MVLHRHHRNVVELHRIRQRHQRTIRGADRRRLVVVDPIADIFDAGRGEQVWGLQRLRQPRAKPADRPLAGKALDHVERMLDHRFLVWLQMNRTLLIGMAHEFPAVIFCLFGHARIILADPRIDRERRSYVLSLKQVKEAPHADPHAVFMPAPVRHVGEMRHSGRRRQHLARHRFADVPDFKIDDAPEYKTRFIRKLERGPIDDG